MENEAKQNKVGGWGEHRRKLDINTATEKELKSIPDIGTAMARKIIAARPFKSADELKKVKGIGQKKYVEFRPYFQ